MHNNYIGFLIGSTLLDPAEGFELTLEELNQMFDLELIQGSFSYPFKLAHSPKNRLALGLPEIIDNINDLPENIPCYLLIGSTIYKHGLLTVTKYAARSYEATFYSDTSTLVDIKDRKLNEFTYGGIKDLGITDADRIINMSFAAASGWTNPIGLSWEGMTFFELKAHNFISGRGDQFSAGEPFTYINPFNGTFNQNGWTEYCPIVPFFFLRFILTDIFTSCGIRISFTSEAFALIDPVVFFNNYDIGAPVGTPGTGGYWDNTYAEPNRYVLPINHLPGEKTISELLASMRKAFGLYLHFEEGHIKFYTINEIISDSEELDITSLCGPPTEIDFIPADGIRLEQLKAAITAPSAELPGYDFNKGRITGGIYEGTFDTVADLPAIVGNQWALVLEDNYWYNPNVGLTVWEARFLNYEPKITHKGGNGVSDVPGSTYMVRELSWHDINSGEGSMRLTPVVNCAGTEPNASRQNPWTEFTFLFWRGNQPDIHYTSDSGGVETDPGIYPMGSSGFVDVNGAVIGEELNLQVDGVDGIYEKQLKKMANLLYNGNKKVIVPVKAGLADFIKITPLKRVSIQGNKYIYYNKTSKITSAGIADCTLELLRI